MDQLFCSIEFNSVFGDSLVQGWVQKKKNDAKIGVECSIEFLAQPLDTREYSHDKLEL